MTRPHPAQPRALVANAADAEQVAEAGLRETVAMQDAARSWAAVLATPEGRAVLWDVMGYAGTFGTITVQSSEIYTKTGARDVGLRVQRQILETDERAFLTMMEESYAAARKIVSPKSLKEKEDHAR